MGATQQRGEWAEHLAAQWLTDNGFRVRHMNWRSGRYELDIVAERGAAIHFVEVKCRRRGALTSPEDAINPAKFRSLSKAAEAYLAMYGVDLEPQFDAVAVEYEGDAVDIKYIPDAMTPAW